jgi:Putative peptidoglycan binding domain
LVKAAEVKEVKVPAEVKKIKVRELVRPATKKEVKVPAEYALLAHERVITPEKVVWQRVVCPDKITPELIKSVQAKLKEKGSELGEPDGVWNDATKAAVVQYQTKNSLAVAGLSYALIEHLGLPAVQ